MKFLNSQQLAFILDIKKEDARPVLSIGEVMGQVVRAYAKMKEKSNGK